MTTKLTKFRIALGATALFAASLIPSTAFAADAAEHQPSATVGQSITDTAISTKIRAKLLADKRIKNSDISVNTTNGEVTLSGTSASDSVTSAAKEIAKGTDGVTGVSSNLTVVATTSAGQSVTDAAITTKVKAKLLADSRIKGSSIKVKTKDGDVTLSGSASTSDVSDAAKEIAKGTDGVKDVDNDIVVANTPTVGQKVGKAADKTGEAVSDSYITSKIKSQLLAAKGVSSAGITVETNDGVVTLSGHVPRKSEMIKAIKIAKQTKGVKSVESGNFEVQAEG